MNKQTLPWLLLFLHLTSTLAAAQEEDPAMLDLDRILSSEFASQGFGPARWLQDGSGYTLLEASNSEGGGRDIVKYDPASGSRNVLIPSKLLTPPGEPDPLHVADYAWSTDRRKLLIFTNTRRVWRRHTRGDYWVLDLGTGRLTQLGGDGPEAALMFAKFSPDGRRVAFVRDKNIYVEDLDDRKITALTTDGSGTLINGTFDWVYEEEFGLRDGFRWSPDGERLAFWQLDSEGVRTFFLIDNIGGLYSSVKPIPYPKAGEQNSACRVGVVSAEGGDITWLDVPGDERNNYIARMDWTERSEEIVIQRLNRLQNENRVMLGDAETGKMRTVFSDRDEAWVEVMEEMLWLEGGERFLWVSERDGWRHVYRVSRSGDDVKLITPGPYDVISLEGVDEEGGWLYFIASPGNATQRYLFRISLEGGEADRITPLDMPGTHSYDISPDGRWAFHTYSAFGLPPRIEVVSLPDHEVKRVLMDNEELRKKVEALKRGASHFFRVDIGEGVELDGWCIRPPDFDPSALYPVLFHVYGEPAGQTVLDRWGRRYYLWHLMLAQKGYVIMSVDNRGTPAPRGRAWRKCIYRQVGILASEDQAAALEAIGGRWPWVDRGRIGIWGWSGGGSMSLNMIFRYPDLYHTAIAIATISNQRFYDTIYQERYMGLPEDNEEGFKEGSPITYAHQLEGNLLLIHGTADDNCHYQSCEALVDELIAARKQFRLMSYPNRSHGLWEGRGTQRHLYELMTSYLLEKLPPGPRN